MRSLAYLLVVFMSAASLTSCNSDDGASYPIEPSGSAPVTSGGAGDNGRGGTGTTGTDTVSDAGVGGIRDGGTAGLGDGGASDGGATIPLDAFAPAPDAAPSFPEGDQVP